MDFGVSEDQQQLVALAHRVFADHAGPERVAEVEAGPTRMDDTLWRHLAETGLLGVAVPPAHGGLGLGMVELGLLLQEQGRRVAPVPLFATLALGGLVLGEFATAAQQARWLPGVVRGDTVLTGAFAEWGRDDAATSSVRATADGDVWQLNGAKPVVPAAHVSHGIMVPAVTDNGLTVFIVDPAAPGVARSHEERTNRELHATVTFDDIAVADDHRVGAVGGGGAIITWLRPRISVALAALTLGCCEEATRLAAEHTSTRHQFGRPLSTNQGVALRLADCAIDAACLQVAWWQAAWRLDAGRDADDEATIAKWWAAHAGSRIVHATQHLHGGTGADVHHPVHRTFLWVRQLTDSHGGASAHLAALGASIAARARAAAVPSES